MTIIFPLKLVIVNGTNEDFLQQPKENPSNKSDNVHSVHVQKIIMSKNEEEHKYRKLW